MEVIYEPRIIEKIANAQSEARSEGRTIREIILTMEEWKELMQVSREYFKGEPGEIKTVCGIHVVPKCTLRNQTGFTCDHPGGTSQCDNCSCNRRPGDYY